MENAKVLIVDDEKNILESVKMVLNYEQYNVQAAKDGVEAIDLFKKFLPDIVLLDVKMPGLDGLKVLQTFKELNPVAEVIMISGHSGIEEAVEASRLGAFDFLEKPISRDKLVLTVRNAAEKISLLKENFNLRNLTAKKYELVGKSQVMKALQETIRRVARSDSTVLISGDSGTGKELIARLIHQQSARSQNRFVQVNCAAIPDELIESELFGHEKGSFTGAYEKKIGKFESAHRGSIFLDEIGDLSLKAQAKVLRVLEEGEVQPVGSPRDQEGQRARHRRHQQGPGGGDPQGELPRGPLFPPARGADPFALPARAQGGHPAADRPFHRLLLGGEQLPHEGVLGRGAAAAARTTRGRAMSASCATWSSGC